MNDIFKGSMLRCGDHVKHFPSGEIWVVAWADDEKLCAAGWPHEHLEAVRDWVKSSGSSRRSKVLAMYPDAVTKLAALAKQTA
jgi:hypothetical protein